MSIIKGTNQIVAGFGGTKRSIGEVYFSQSALATDNSGALPLFTGETIASANTIYPEFYNWVSAHTELQCTSAQYEASLTTYGECAKYVIGGGSLRLPKLSNYIKVANSAEGITQKGAGLPNIDSDTNWVNVTGGTETNATNTNVLSNKGAFGGTNSQGGHGINGNDYPINWRRFDASKSNAIYGSSDTVQPAHTTLYPWISAYTSAIPASVAQAAEFQQALSGKADTNLGNLSTAGKDLASGLGMPSSRYIDLTLGASGSTYTAPANGWIVIKISSTGGWTQLRNQSAAALISANSLSPYAGMYLPVKKGDTFQVEHPGSADMFRFIYAEGAE